MRQLSARLYPGAVVLVALAAALLVLTDAHTPFRAVVEVAFLLVGPGMAIVTLLDVGDPLERLVLAIAVSLSLDVVVSLGMLYGGFWSPRLGISILAGIAILATGLSCFVGRRGHIKIEARSRKSLPPTGRQRDSKPD